MRKQKTGVKLEVLAVVFIFMSMLLMSHTSAKNVICSELTASECRANYKCFFNGNDYLIFEKWSCVDAKDYYSSKTNENKLENLDKNGKGISGFFINIYGKITGKANVNLPEAYEGEEADLGNYRKETFYVNAGSKLLAKIVKE